jgi:hypothetical protein
MSRQIYRGYVIESRTLAADNPAVEFIILDRNDKKVWTTHSEQLAYGWVDTKKKEDSAAKQKG